MPGSGLGLRMWAGYDVGPEDLVARPDIDTQPAALADYLWGDGPPTPSRIPYSWLTQQLHFRPDKPINVADVNQASGTPARSVNAASVGEYGEFTANAITLFTTCDADPANLAAHLTGTYADPRWRCPQITLDLLPRTDAERWLILARTEGDRIQLTGVPGSFTVTDAFTRTVGNGWGSADTGQAWSNVGGTSADYSVSGSRGVHSLSSVNVTRRSVLSTVSSEYADITVGRIGLSATPTGAALEVGAVARHVDASNYIAGRIFFNPDNTVTVAIQQLAGGAETFVGFPAILGATAGTAMALRLQVIGTTARLRAWDAGLPEPADWNLTMQVGSVSAGALGVQSVLNAGNTNTLPLSVDIDNVSAGSPGAWPEGTTSLLIEGIQPAGGVDDRVVTWNASPVIGAVPGAPGPWFRADSSRLDGTDKIPY